MATKTVNTKVTKKTSARRKPATRKTAPKVKTADLKAKATATAEKATDLGNDIFAKAKKEVQDVVNRGKKLSADATKQVNKAVKNLSVKKTVDSIKTSAKNANEFTLETAEEIVDGVVTGGEKWQGLTKKAINGSLELASKQQEIVFDALESAKNQATKSFKRAKNLFSKN